MRIPIVDVRRNILLIAWLSVGLVIVSAVLLGLVVHALFPQIPLALCIALGAVVGPPDSVAATAVGRRLGLPPRVMTVLEAESMVNDATALVLLRASLVAASVGSFSLGQATLALLWAVVGAVAVGLAVGFLTVLLRARLGDPVLNTTISFAVPFLAFFPAEEMGTSGVLAVVVAGLVTGHMAPRHFTAHDRQTEATNWATVNFVLESGVFVLMGLELPRLIDDAGGELPAADVWLLVAVVVAMLVALRFLGVGVPLLIERGIRRRRFKRAQAWAVEVEERLEALYPKRWPRRMREERLRRRMARSIADAQFRQREPITNGDGLVLAWAGMRGVVTLAAAQSIPTDTEYRALLVLVALMVSVATLVGLGGTLSALIRRVDVTVLPTTKRNAEYAQLMAQLAQRTVEVLGPLKEATVDGEPLDPEMRQWLARRFVPVLRGVPADLRKRKPDSWERAEIVQRRYLNAMQQALWEERSIGAYSSGTYAAAQALLDREERRLNPLD